ncbi:MAG: GTP-binding protein [Agathobacter sp.]|nr:GTP-binding protein [Agathobacter sp.]
MIKIDIISGFLGAGKTTFIKKMIDEAFSGEKIVLIENEFGEVGIDGGFLKDAGIQISEMNSGCICCSLVGDFGKNLHEVIAKYHPDRILIEPSGVGKLSDVMKSVIDIEKEEDVKLNALVTVVNALKAAKQMKAFGEFFNNQIEHATTVILSRSQNASQEQLEFCVNRIRELNPKAAVITTDWSSLKGEQILKVIEGQDNLEMKALAELHHEQDEAEHEHEHEHHHEHEGHEHHHDHEGHEHHHDHEHEGHEHHHDHEHEGHEHEHEHHHDHEDHEHEEHEHHHDHEGHEHHHEHEEHEHHHDHEHEEHEHHHDHEGHEHHHEHDENCTCGCHDHDHEHHHHHADDIFTSWGKETPRKFERARIEEILKGFAESDNILRAKGMVESVDGGWIYFDMVPGEYELREGEPDYTGRIVVIGTEIHEHELEELFGLV